MTIAVSRRPLTSEAALSRPKALRSRPMPSKAVRSRPEPPTGQPPTGQSLTGQLVIGQLRTGQPSTCNDLATRFVLGATCIEDAVIFKPSRYPHDIVAAMCKFSMCKFKFRPALRFKSDIPQCSTRAIQQTRQNYRHTCTHTHKRTKKSL